MKNISYSVKPEGLLGNIKTADVFHHPVQAKNMNFNPYILYYQSNLLNYLPPTSTSYPLTLSLPSTSKKKKNFSAKHVSRTPEY